jgi:regulator of sirC expression with transglutaminase-like and TPR domain
MQPGRVLTHPALARQRFREIAELPEQRIDLVEASLVIALEDRPGLEIGHYLDEVEGMARRTTSQVVGANWRACPTSLGEIERVVESINRILFDEEGFHGEDEDYYDPRSALLNELLDTHAGTPITLSILYLEMTRRVGFEATGVSLPGRFLVKFSGEFGQIVVDPYDGGRILTTPELQKMLDGVYGGGVRLREHHLRSLTRKEIVARELAHLKSAYLAQHDLARAAASADRLLILDDRDAFELRDRAALAMQMHAYAVAIECLERYVALQPHADDITRVREQIAYLSAWIDQN